MRAAVDAIPARSARTSATAASSRLASSESGSSSAFGPGLKSREACFGLDLPAVDLLVLEATELAGKAPHLLAASVYVGDAVGLALDVEAKCEAAEKDAQEAVARLDRVKRDYANGDLTAAEWRELRAAFEPERGSGGRGPATA